MLGNGGKGEITLANGNDLDGVGVFEVVLCISDENICSDDFDLHKKIACKI